MSGHIICLSVADAVPAPSVTLADITVTRKWEALLKSTESLTVM